MHSFFFVSIHYKTELLKFKIFTFFFFLPPSTPNLYWEDFSSFFQSNKMFYESYVCIVGDDTLKKSNFSEREAFEKKNSSSNKFSFPVKKLSLKLFLRIIIVFQKLGTNFS